MDSKLIVCIGMPNSGLGLYSRLISQFPYVTDCSALLNTEIGDFGHTSMGLRSGLLTLIAKPGLYFYAPSDLPLQAAVLSELSDYLPDLAIHYVFLLRHPFEIAWHAQDEESPLRILCDWCSAIDFAAKLPNCHVTIFDELIADPVASLEAFFRTIPDRRLTHTLRNTEFIEQLIASVQPAHRTVFFLENIGANDTRYQVFFRIYCFLKMVRFFRRDQICRTIRLVLGLFTAEGPTDQKIIDLARSMVNNPLSGFEETGFEKLRNQVGPAIDVAFSSALDKLRPKQILRDTLLRIAEDARKEKILNVAESIYQFLLLIDWQSYAALTGLALTLNDKREWGGAFRQWTTLFSLLERHGTPIGAVQLKGRTSCEKSLLGDFDFLLKKSVHDISALREYIEKNPAADGHIAVMRTWKYLASATRRLHGTLLINDTRTQNNIGCYATTNELIHRFEQEGITIDHSVTLIELERLADLLFGPGPLMPGSDFNYYVNKFVSNPEFHAYRELIFLQKIIIVNGEGSFYDRQRKGLVLCVLMAFAKKYAECQVLCINHSADLHDELMRRWVYQAYQQCDYISLREHVSFARLPDEFRCFQIAVVPDAAYSVVNQRFSDNADLFHGLDQIMVKSINSPYVVISGTSAIFRGDREGFFIHHVLSFNSLLRTILAEGYHVVLLASDGSDYKLLRQAAIDLGLPLVSSTSPVASLLALFSGATAFISGRWHTSIIAACAGCPSVLGDANFFKTSALHDSYQYPWPMFDFRNLAHETSKILVAIEYCKSEGIHKDVKERARQFESEVTKAFSRMVDLISAI